MTRGICLSTVRAIELAVGRGRLARAARFLTNAVRLDVPNQMGSNGEELVVEAVLRNRPAAGAAVFIDCGANIGEYSLMAYRLSERLRSGSVLLHSLEPSAYTFEQLRGRVSAVCPQGQIQPHRLALSDKPDPAAKFRVNALGGGTNTLHGGTEDPAAHFEQVQVTTLDLFCEQHAIPTVDLLKIDTEGNDYNVMIGARQMLASGRIRVVQFEYNYRWIYARRFLRDAFELLRGWEYQVGKITPRGVEFYREWHPELEKFVEGNYLACRADCAGFFPRIPWWGDQVCIPRARA
jgi:FkbM family methyltransferase